MATCTDDAIANITEALQQRGMWHNTVFIFSTGRFIVLNCNIVMKGIKNHSVSYLIIKVIYLQWDTVVLVIIPTTVNSFTPSKYQISKYLQITKSNI